MNSELGSPIKKEQQTHVKKGPRWRRTDVFIADFENDFACF